MNNVLDKFFFFSSKRRHTRSYGDWSSDVCSSDLAAWMILAAISAATPGATPHSTEPRTNAARSEERRVGKECRSRGSPYHKKKKSNGMVAGATDVKAEGNGRNGMCHHGME